MGELINVIDKEVETSNQLNSQGAADADVQAEKGQAKERAWELFMGWWWQTEGLKPKPIVPLHWSIIFMHPILP